MTEKRVPKLRFRDKNGEEFPDWDVSLLGSVSDVRDGTHNSPKYYPIGFPLITSKNLLANGLLDMENVSYISKEDYEQINTRSKVDIGDIIFGMIGTIGNPVLIQNDGFAIKNVALIKEKKQISNTFLIHYLKSSYIKRQFHTNNTGNTQKFIALGKIRKLPVCYPFSRSNIISEEQQKIADFLSAVDEKINLLQQQKTLWQEYKQGAMQQVFSQKIRFKDDDGEEFPEWDFKSVKEIAQKVHSKNKNNNINKVLTNSAELGIVDQGEFFDKDIANKNNLSNYYVVNKDSFVYNPRISKKAPVGPIKRNHLSKGVMSPLYTVFKFSEGCLDFFEYYFESSFWYEYMYSIANFGARHDRMNITTNDFFELPIPYPIKKEQQKIANFLSALDQKVNQIDNQITAAQTWKQGLMQQMFI